MKRLFKTLFGSKTTQKVTKNRQAKRVRLSLEMLESRETPVIGATTAPAAVAAGTGFDGVVRLNLPGGGCTGALLFTGRHILTAAHCVDANLNGTVDPGVSTVTFDMPGQPIAIQNIPAANITMHPGWNGNLGNGNDLAIIRLTVLPPSGPRGIGAERYDIFRGSNEVGQVFTFLGYGGTNRINAATGTFSSGATAHDGSFGTKRMGQNRFEFVSRTSLGPANGTDLVFDFDDGSRANNSLDTNTLDSDLGLGTNEANTANGDSGGPSFLGGRVAAVTSFGFNAGSQFGDISFNTRVSVLAGFVDQTVGGNYGLVLDMNSQLARNNGSADNIIVRVSGANLVVYVNGNVVHQDALSKINSLTITGSNDRDVIRIEGNLGKPITVNAGQGNDELKVIGTASGDTVTVSTGAVMLGSTSISYSDIQNLSLETGGGDDVITVRSTAAATPVNINSGDDNDTFNVGSTARTLDAIQGTLTLDGGNHTFRDVLNLYDQGSTSAKTYTLQPGALSRSGAALVSFPSVETVTIHAGSATDTLVGPNMTNQWDITSNDRGYVNSIGFRSIENLVGGTSKDVFTFMQENISVNSINAGGSRYDRLDFNRYSTGIKVDLTGGSAPGVRTLGGVQGIENVMGGSGNDLLLGNAADNMLWGNGGWDELRGQDGNDVLVGSYGNDLLVGGNGRDLLIGGADQDTLYGGDDGYSGSYYPSGSDEDILIGGSTSHDASDTALSYLMAEWTGTDLKYDDRIANLVSGKGRNGSYRLISGLTVLDDGIKDKLVGQKDLDWFFASADVVADLEAGERIS